jgi:drug/metabolite transporter (DMT)-like permease
MEDTATKRWIPGFIALGVIWGSSFLFIKWGLLTLTSIGVAFLRCLIGGLTLLVFAAITRSKLPNKIIEWVHIAVVAFFLNALPGYLFAYGETHVSSVMAGLLNATTPLMTVLVISLAFREQRVDINQSLGVVIGFGGIALVTGALTGLNASDWHGIVALLGATLCYGISMPYSKRFVSKLDYSATSLAAAQVSCAALLLAPFALIGGVTHTAWHAKSVLGMLALGAVGTGIAYILNFHTIRAAGSAIASTVTFITPVVATVLGIWLLKEKFSVSQVLGGVLVFLSAALVQKRIRIVKRVSQ